ncbi:MAG: cohesin domain-containing protein [Euryarchaeota archaeon]|nr:cohesin domain-containing protein [Euryarchaeota archaeon]
MKELNRRTIAGLIISAIVLTCIPIAAAATVVSIDDASAHNGDTIEVPIRITGVTDMCGADITLYYDTAVVSVEEMKAGDLGSVTSSKDDVGGAVKMVWDATDGKTGDFVIMYVTLKALGDPCDGCALNLEVNELYDCDLGDIEHSVQDGTFKVLPCGDPVTSTTVSIDDASAHNGDTIEVPIRITGVTDMCGADITLSYDTAVVSVEEMEAGDLGSVTSSKDDANGTVKMVWDATDGKTGDFVIMYVTLKALGDPCDGCTLNLVVNELYDCDLGDIEHSVQDGTFKVLPCGDPVTSTTVSIEDATAQEGETVEVPIRITGVTDMCGADITLSYDAAVVSVEEMEAGDLGSVTSSKDDVNGTVKMVWDATDGKTGDFVVMYVTLKAKGTTGDNCTLDLVVNELYDCDLGDIGHSVQDGTFEVGNGATSDETAEVYFSPQRSIAALDELATVEICVDAKNNSFQSGQLNITYPSEYANVTDWALNEDDFSMGLCTLTPGGAWITFVASGPLTGEHTIGTLTVQRVEDACHTAQLVFVEPSLLCEDRGLEIEVEWNNGILTCDGVCGDVNEDGVVDIKDVTLLLNYVNLPFAYQICEWCGDVTGDGTIDIRDVTLLLNHVNNPKDCPLCCR